MTSHEAELLDRLFEAPDPTKVDRCDVQDGYYVAACRISANDVPGLIDVARRWSDPNWPGDAVRKDIAFEHASLLPVTAWRALGDLKAEVAVEALIDILTALDDEQDDWAAEELPHVFGRIGEVSFEPLVQIATDTATPEFIRSIAVHGLGQLASYHAHTRDRVVACLANIMANATSDNVRLNTSLLNILVDLEAVEAAEPIERAFAGNLLDVGMLGDWESVRRTLGVEGLRLKMPQHPYNSLERFRTRIGIGIFSEKPLFATGEIDANAETAYYKRAFSTFSRSSEAQQVIDRYGDLGWFQRLLEFGINYLGETVDEMTCASVQEFVLEYIPRKVAIDSTAATKIIGELVAFWKYVDRVYDLPAAKSVVDWLTTESLVAQLGGELSRPANFGMAKSLMSLGKSAGYDMTSEAGLQHFMLAYNASLLSGKQPQDPTAGRVRVGRNEPCPCGSGKKFKKCCARDA